MDNSSPLILEISSDEEAGFGDARKGDYTGGGGGFYDGEDHNWLSELLGEVDRNKDDDSDEVVLVSVSNPKKSRLQSSKPSTEIVVNSGGDDDDCVVLDFDPDQPRVVENGRADNVDDDGDSDDLEIVGEKGEVACRDFPHPRHLCAKFAFVSTPHEVHCGQCHCYVCDSLAPCAHWGTGISSIDHCHASDKDEYWIAERKSLKKGTSVASFSAGLPQTTEVSAFHLPPPNSLLQNEGLRPVTIHPCSMSSNVRVPNVINQGRSHSSGRVVPRYKHQPQIVPQRLPTTCHSNITSMDNNRSPVNRSPQFIHPPPFKKPGLVGEASPNNRHGHDKRYYRSQISRGSSLKKCPTFQTPVLNSYHGFNQQNIGRRAASSVIPQPKLSVPQSMNAGSANYIPFQSQRHSQPHSSCLVRDPIPCQPQMPSQPYVSNNFENGIPFQTPVASQPNLGNLEDMVLPQPDMVFQPNCPIPSQTLVSKYSDAGNAYENHMHSRSMIPPHHNMSNTFENQSSQPQAYSNPTSLLIDGQNDFQQRSQSQNDLNTSATDFGFNWDSFFGHDSVQCSPEISQLQSAAPSDHFLYQSITENDHNQSIAPADNFHLGTVPPPDNSPLIDDTHYHFPGNTNPSLLNFQFLFENQSLRGALEVNPLSPGLNVLSPGLNVLSPEPASIDADTLFDF